MGGGRWAILFQAEQHDGLQGREIAGVHLLAQAAPQPAGEAAKVLRQFRRMQGLLVT